MEHWSESFSKVGIMLSVMLIILGCLMLVVLLTSCSSGEESWTRVNRDRAYRQACMEFGYPEFWENIDTDIIFCMRRTECSDDVIKLTTLRSRERG